MRRALDAHLYAALPWVAWALGCLYGIYALAAVLGTIEGRVLVPLWASLAVAFLAAAWLLQRRRVDVRWAHALLGGAAGAVLVATNALLWAAGDLFFTLVHILALLGFAVLALSLRWYLGLIVVTLVSWGVTVTWSDPSGPADAAAVMLGSAGVLGSLAQAMRVRAYRHIHRLHRQREQHSRETTRMRLDQVRAEEALRRREAVDDEKRRFLNAAAHELYTPLTPMRLRIAQLHELVASHGTERDQRALNVIERNTGRLADTVANLIRATRTSSSAFELDAGPLDLADVLDDVADELRPLARQKGLRLVQEYAGPLPLHGDAYRIHDAVYNVTENAIKYTRHGEVRLTAGRHDGVRVSVADTGPGMGPDAHRAFEPFTQLGDPDRRTEAGWGLGLFVAKLVTEAHGGSIRIDGRDGGGTECVLWFPEGAGAVETPGQAPAPWARRPQAPEATGEAAGRAAPAAPE